MKQSKLIAGIIFLLAVVCLVSVPVFSGENPWDADGGNRNGTGSPTDSLSNDLSQASAVQSQPQTLPDDSQPGWVTRATLRVSSYIIELFSKKTIKKVQVNRPAY